MRLIQKKYNIRFHPVRDGRMGKGNKMTENDYIAEYIKEKRPEIISSLDFIGWKIARMITDSINSFADTLADFARSVIGEKNIEEDEQDDETRMRNEDTEKGCGD